MSDEPTATGSKAGAPEAGLPGDVESPIATASSALLEALEICAGSVLALEASLDKLPANTQSDRDARETIQAAIELVTAALVTVRGQAPGAASSDLALGFVNRRVRRRPDET